MSGRTGKRFRISFLRLLIVCELRVRKRRKWFVVEKQGVGGKLPRSYLRRTIGYPDDRPISYN